MPLAPNIEFPDYEFREYPKMVYPGGHKPNGKGQAQDGVLVNNEAEEHEALSTGEAPVREGDELTRLQKVADIKGVTFDKRWGAPKLVKAITDAGFDPTLDPDA